MRKFTFKGIVFYVTPDTISFNERKFDFSLHGAMAIMFALKVAGFDNYDIRLMSIKARQELALIN